jgi:hypothetical protein
MKTLVALADMGRHKDIVKLKMIVLFIYL